MKPTCPRPAVCAATHASIACRSHESPAMVVHRFIATFGVVGAFITATAACGYLGLISNRRRLLDLWYSKLGVALLVVEVSTSCAAQPPGGRAHASNTYASLQSACPDCSADQHSKKCRQSRSWPPSSTCDYISIYPTTRQQRRSASGSSSGGGSSCASGRWPSFSACRCAIAPAALPSPAFAAGWCL